MPLESLLPETGRCARRHLLFGWGALLVFLTLGAVPVLYAVLFNAKRPAAA